MAPYFELASDEACAIPGEVGRAVRGWRDMAARFALAADEIERMASAFEHRDLEAALRMGAVRGGVAARSK